MTPRRRARRAFAFLLVTSGLLACEGDPGTYRYANPPDLPTTPWTGWPACDPAARAQTITFVHVSDLHGSYTLDAAGESPVARLRGYYEWVRSESPYTVFTDSGDAMEKGSVAELLSSGVATRQVVEAMGFDLRTLGNHDFAWSLEETLAFTRIAPTITLTTNTRYVGPDPERFGGVDYVALDIGCLKVGFLGLVSPPWSEQNEQLVQPFYPELENDYYYAAVAQRIVDAHRAEVDLLVLLSHAGHSRDLDLAAAVPGLDVILGGHSHDLVTDPELSGNALILHPGAYAEHVARLDLDVDLATRRWTRHRYVLVENAPGTLPASPEVQAAVEAILAEHAPGARLEVARVATRQDAWHIALITARAAVAQLGVDAAAVDTDDVWGAFEPGPVTQQDLVDALRVERQLPGTPGISAFYVASIAGDDLHRLRLALPLHWASITPWPIDPAATYRIALPKHSALDPGLHLPDDVTVTDATHVAEAWELLDAHARARTASCLHLEIDQPITGCFR
jgi:2',3'-cyclic-nucleotide 2'-phosphodiesterase (5'-nucleotidase family)